MLRVSSAVASHPGLRRDENEDAHCLRPDLGLYLVADGMGGHAAGEIASRTVAAAIEQFVSETAGSQPEHPWPLPYDPTLSLEGNRLRIAFCLANRTIGSAVVTWSAFTACTWSPCSPCGRPVAEMRKLTPPAVCQARTMPMD